MEKISPVLDEMKKGGYFHQPIILSSDMCSGAAPSPFGRIDHEFGAYRVQLYVAGG